MPVIASRGAMRPSNFHSRVFISMRHKTNFSRARLIAGCGFQSLRLHPNFPYAGYKLELTAKIFLVKRGGHVTAVMNATEQPRGGERWLQFDDNWSLQNLLALGFERL